MAVVTIGSRKKFTYEIQSDRKNYDKKEYRRNLIVEIIEKYPDIPQTHIIQICVKIAKIPKIVVENLLEELKVEGIIIDTKDKSSPNGPRTWNLETSDKNVQDALYGFDLILSQREYFKKLGKEDPEHFVYRQGVRIMYLIQILWSLIAGWKIFSPRIKNKHLDIKIKKLERLLQTILENLANNNGQLPSIVTNLIKNESLHLKDEYNEFNATDERIRKTTKFDIKKQKLGRIITSQSISLDDKRAKDLHYLL